MIESGCSRKWYDKTPKRAPDAPSEFTVTTYTTKCHQTQQYVLYGFVDNLPCVFVAILNAKEAILPAKPAR